MKKILFLFPTLLLAACADTERYYEVPDEPERPSWTETLERWEQLLPSTGFVDVVETIPADIDHVHYDDFIENQEFKTGRIINITWTGDAVTVDNTQQDKGVKIAVNGTRVVVENLSTDVEADDARGKVTYCLMGAAADGQFKIYSDKKFQLQLAGLDLTCKDGPAINIQTKKRCFVVCTEGTENTLQDGPDYASDAIAEPQEDEKACLFSEGQLIFYGPGQLTVLAQHQHAIASDEYIYVHSSSHITVADAPKDGIHAKEQYFQSGGLVRSYAEKDALQSDTLGIHLTGGYLYLCGSRAWKADGEGTTHIEEPAKVAPISWNISDEDL